MKIKMLKKKEINKQIQMNKKPSFRIAVRINKKIMRKIYKKSKRTQQNMFNNNNLRLSNSKANLIMKWRNKTTIKNLCQILWRRSKMNIKCKVQSKRVKIKEKQNKNIPKLICYQSTMSPIKNRMIIQKNRMFSSTKDGRNGLKVFLFYIIAPLTNKEMCEEKIEKDPNNYAAHLRLALIVIDVIYYF